MPDQTAAPSGTHPSQSANGSWFDQNPPTVKPGSQEWLQQQQSKIANLNKQIESMKPEDKGVLHGLWETIPSLGTLKAAAHSLMNGTTPDLTGQDLISNVVQSHADQMQKAATAWKQGNHVEAAGHALAAAIPLVGPAAAKAGEDIGEGKTGEGIGEAVGLVGQTILPEAVKAGVKARYNTEAGAANGSEAAAETGQPEQTEAPQSGVAGGAGTELPQTAQASVQKRPAPVAEVQQLANKYNAARGYEDVDHSAYPPVNEDFAKNIANAYDSLQKDNGAHPAVKTAYGKLSGEIRDQWDHAASNGYTLEPWTQEGQPYANSHEMVNDVANNKHLYFFTGGEEHPMLGAVDPETGLTQNDMFRAVHDLYGHAAGGYGFGPRGEEAAFQAHSQMFSPEAQAAMATETRGQNSWVNFGQHNYDAEGNPLHIAATEKPYAEQKVDLLPEEFRTPDKQAGQLPGPGSGVAQHFADYLDKTQQPVVNAGEAPGDFLGRLSDWAANLEGTAREQIKSAAQGSTAGMGGGAAEGIINLGVAKMVKGSVGFARWSQDMISELGDEVKPKLRTLYNQAKSAFEDFTNHITPPSGDRASPLSFPTEGDRGSLNRLQRAVNRDPGVGGPDNERTVLQDENGKFAVGKITPQDWMDRVKNNLGPDELGKARDWYAQLEGMFNQHFGQELGPRYALAWLLSQKNASPSFGMTNLFRVADQVRGLPKVGYKAAGLSEPEMLQALRGGSPEGGYSAKLSDFVDSAMGKQARTVMGNDVRGGSPAVIDVWANRDVGKVDPEVLDYVKKRFGPEAAAKLKVDGKGIGESDYEFGSKFHNDLSDHLNKSEYDGGHWTPREVQAVGWTAMQKAMGRSPEYPVDMLNANTRRVSVGLNLSKNSPYTQKYGLTSIPREIADTTLDAIAKQTGTFIRRREGNTGAYQGQPEPATHLNLMGSPEAVKDFMDAAGQALHQDSVIASRALKSGKNTAIDITQTGGHEAASLHDPTTAVEFWKRVQNNMPDSLKVLPEKKGRIDGFQQMTAGDNPGLRTINFNGNWSTKQFDQFADAVDKAAKEIGIDVDVHRLQTELLYHGNDWKENPDGGSYKQRLGERGRSSLQGWLDGNLRPALERQLEAEKARREGPGSGGGAKSRKTGQ